MYVCVWSVFIKQRPNLMFQQWVRFISYGTVHYCPLLVEEREREMTRKLRPCGLTKIFLTWNEPKWFGGVFGHHPWSVLISLIVRQAVMCLWNYYCKHQCGARFHGVVIQSVLSTNAKPACTYLPQINLRLHTQLLPNLGVAKQRYSYPPPTHYGMCATMPLTTKNSTLSCS